MPIFDAAQELFVGDLVKDTYPSPSDEGNKIWIVIEVQKAGSFVRLNKSHEGWHFNDDLMVVSRANKLKERA
tara:strand:- start:324 stop:539 length:216 start_codon:yes stop_codon:yes gene_type:complete